MISRQRLKPERTFKKLIAAQQDLKDRVVLERGRKERYPWAATIPMPRIVVADPMKIRDLVHVECAQFILSASTTISSSSASTLESSASSSCTPARRSSKKKKQQQQEEEEQEIRRRGTTRRIGAGGADVI